MKTRLFLSLTLALLVVTALAAGAQTTPQYDPQLEKHPDQRQEYLKALRPGETTEPAKPESINRAKLLDFFTLAQKHADMRVRAMQIGYEAACAEWLAQIEGQKSEVASRGGKCGHTAGAPHAASQNGNKTVQGLPFVSPWAQYSYADNVTPFFATLTF